MYYVFSNWRTLRELSDKNAFDDLAEEIKKTEMIKISEYKDVNPSAKETYRYICRNVGDMSEDVSKSIHEQAVRMFLENRDVNSLVMIAENPRIFGNLNGEAYEIVKSFNAAKSIALDVFQKKAKQKTIVDPFEEEVKSVNVKFNSGKLSFKFEDEYFTIFYGL